MGRERRVYLYAELYLMILVGLLQNSEYSLILCNSVWHQPPPRLSLGVLRAQGAPCSPLAGAYPG